MKKSVYILFFVIAWLFIPLLCPMVSAQQKTTAPQITGTVIDEHGSPVIGATVVVTGTQS